MTEVTETSLAVIPMEETIKLALPKDIFEADIEELRVAINSIYADKDAPKVLAKILKAQLPVNDPSTESGRKVIASFDKKACSFRVKVEKIGNDIKADADAYVAKVIGARKGFTAELQTVIDDYFRPVEEFREKEKTRLAECERIQSTITQLGTPVFGDTSAAVVERLAKLEDIATLITEETFRDGEPIATVLLSETLTALREHRDAMFVQEAEAARIAEERAELERLRQAEVDREAKEAEDKRLAKIKEDARIEAERDAARKVEEATASAVQAERERLDIEHQEALKLARKEVIVEAPQEPAQTAVQPHSALKTFTAYKGDPISSPKEKETNKREKIITAFMKNGVDDETAILVTDLIIDGEIEYVEVI